MGTPRSSGNALTAAELVALTDELASLARAGVPFESGLARSARDLARRPGNVAAAIADRMQKGESLQQIIADSPEIFPPAYRAVVEAGMRSGKLSAALEGLSESSQRVGELKRMTRTAMIYPLLIVFMAYGLFVFSVIRIQPLVRDTYEIMKVPGSPFNLALVELGQTAQFWGPAVAVIAIALVAMWWRYSVRPHYSDRAFSGISPFRRLRQYGRITTFADVLALLIEHQTPLDQSLVLAADSSGDARLSHACHRVAEEIERGGKGDSLRQELAAFPPLLGWLLANASQQPENLVKALRDMAEAYRHRAKRLDTWLRIYLPMLLTVAIGGTAVFLYALALFIPWFNMLREAAFAK